MPTGYTAPIVEDEGFTLREYMLRVARAFILSAREVPLGKTLTRADTKPRSVKWEERSLREAEAELAELEALDDAAKPGLARAAYEDRLDTYKRRCAKANQKRERYLAMLEQVACLRPPTPQHENYHRFLAAQIEQSMEFDCTLPPLPSDEAPEAWYQRCLEAARSRVKNAALIYERVSALAAEDEQWIEAFWAWLPEEK